MRCVSTEALNSQGKWSLFMSITNLIGATKISTINYQANTSCSSTIIILCNTKITHYETFVIRTLILTWRHISIVYCTCAAVGYCKYFQVDRYYFNLLHENYCFFPRCFHDVHQVSNDIMKTRWEAVSSNFHARDWNLLH